MGIRTHVIKVLLFEIRADYVHNRIDATCYSKHTLPATPFYYQYLSYSYLRV